MFRNYAGELYDYKGVKYKKILFSVIVSLYWKEQIPMVDWGVDKIMKQKIISNLYQKPDALKL